MPEGEWKARGISKGGMSRACELDFKILDFRFGYCILAALWSREGGAEKEKDSIRTLPPLFRFISAYGNDWHYGRLLISISVGTRGCANVYNSSISLSNNIWYLLRSSCPMSSTPNTTSTASNFQAIFDAALKDYTKKTGKDLSDLHHPLASKLDTCDTPDSIINIFQEQAREFGEFRKGDTKLLKWLKPIVKILHPISTNKVLSDSVSSVNSAAFIIYHHPCH